jgi:hypothetical protein
MSDLFPDMTYRGRPEAEEEITLPEGATSLHFMQAIYRDPGQPITRRMRAAQIAIAYEHPKLAVTVNTDVTGFASQMEEVMRRSGKSTVIDAKANYDTSAPLPIPRRLPQAEAVVTDPSGGFKRRF